MTRGPRCAEPLKLCAFAGCTATAAWVGFGFPRVLACDACRVRYIRHASAGSAIAYWQPLGKRQAVTA